MVDLLGKATLLLAHEDGGGSFYSLAMVPRTSGRWWGEGCLEGGMGMITACSTAPMGQTSRAFFCSFSGVQCARGVSKWVRTLWMSFFGLCSVLVSN